MSKHRLAKSPNLDDLFQFLSQFSKVERESMIVVIGKSNGDGTYFADIDDIRLPDASLRGGLVRVVDTKDDGPREAMDSAEESRSITCFRIA